jgi:AcrR family transcriptional regulator
MGALESGSTALRIKEPVQRRAKETHNRIIEAARAVFAEHGFDAATTTMIAEGAGVSIGSVYAHFEDKIEIFIEILAAHSEAVYRYSEAQVTRIMEGNEEPGATLDWLIAGMYQAHKLSGKLNFEMTRFVLMNERAEKIHAEWEAKEDELIISFLRHFRDKIRTDDPSAAALIVHRSLHEVFQYLFRNRDRVDETRVLAEFTRMLKRSLLR